MPEIPPELQDLKLFSNFEAEAFEILMEDSTVLELSSDETLFEQGDPPENAFFVVLSGEIGIRKLMRNEKEIVARLKPGEFLGELGLFSDRDRQAGGVATESSRVLRVPRASLSKLKRQSPGSLVDLYESMFESLSGRFKALAEKAEKTQFWL